MSVCLQGQARWRNRVLRYVGNVCAVVFHQNTATENKLEESLRALRRRNLFRPILISVSLRTVWPFRNGTENHNIIHTHNCNRTVHQLVIAMALIWWMCFEIWLHFNTIKLYFLLIERLSNHEKDLETIQCTRYFQIMEIAEKTTPFKLFVLRLEKVYNITLYKIPRQYVEYRAKCIIYIIFT